MFHLTYANKRAGLNFNSPLVFVNLGIFCQIFILTSCPTKQQNYGNFFFIHNENEIVFTILIVVEIRIRKLYIILQIVYIHHFCYTTMRVQGVIDRSPTYTTSMFCREYRNFQVIAANQFTQINFEFKLTVMNINCGLCMHTYTRIITNILTSLQVLYNPST